MQGMSTVLLILCDKLLQRSMCGNDIGSGCRRPHQSLASVGVAALVRLIVAAGDRMSTSVWVEAITALHNCAAETCPVSRLPSFAPYTNRVVFIMPYLALTGTHGTLPRPIPLVKQEGFKFIDWSFLTCAQETSYNAVHCPL